MTNVMMVSRVQQMYALEKMDAPMNLIIIDAMMDLVVQPTFVIHYPSMLMKTDASTLQMMTCARTTTIVQPPLVHQMMKMPTMKDVFTLQMMINAMMNMLAQEISVGLMVVKTNQFTLNAMMDLHVRTIPVIQAMKTQTQMDVFTTQAMISVRITLSAQ